MHRHRSAWGAMLVGTSAGLGIVEVANVWGEQWVDRFLAAQVVLALVAAWLVVPRRTQGRAQISAARAPLMLLVGWLLWALLAGLFRDGPASLLSWAPFATLALAAVMVFPHSQESLLAVAAAAAAAVHGVAAVAASFSAPYNQEHGGLRLVALESNHLARLLALVALLSIVQVWGRRRRHPTIPVLAWALISLVCLAMLILTESRTAVAALFAGAVVWLLASGRWRALLVSIALLVLGTGVLTAWEPTGAVLSSQTGQAAADIPTLTGRTVLWPAVVKSVAAQPILGVGIGNDRPAVAAVAAEIGLGWSPLHTHNLALHVLLATGWVGAVLFGTFLFSGLLANWRSEGPVNLVVLAALTLVLVDGVSEAVIATAGLSWVVIAVFAANHPAATIGEGVGAAAAGRPLGAGVPTSAAASLLLSAAVAIGPLAAIPLRYECRSAVTGAQRRGDDPLVHVETAGLDGRLFPLPPSAGQAIRCAGGINGSLTVEAWVRVAATDQEGPARIFTVSSGTEWGDIDLHLGQERENLSVRVRRSERDRIDEQIEGVFSSTGLWRHVALVLDTDGGHVFIDGQESSLFDGPVDFASWRTDREVLLGNEATGDRPFHGDIADLAVWATALDPHDLVGHAANRPGS